MAYQLNEGQGSLFVNTYKDINDPNDRKPHFKGHCLVNGQEKEIAGWWAQKQSGEQYIQLKITEPRTRPQQGAPGGYAPQAPAQPQPRYAQAAPQQAPQQQVQPLQQYQRQQNNPLQPQDDDLPF